eukprot:gene8042-1276_t
MGSGGFGGKVWLGPVDKSADYPGHPGVPWDRALGRLLSSFQYKKRLRPRTISSSSVRVRLRTALKDAEASGPNTLEKHLDYRISLKTQIPNQRFFVAGVSFEGRQEAVKGLTFGQHVMLRRTPWNQYDSNAVEVSTLAGLSLGFVPKAVNPEFQTHEVVCGEVLTVGSSNTSDLLGVQIRTQAGLMALTADPLPTAHAMSLKKLQTAIGAQRWTTLKNEAFDRTKSTCEIMGVPSAKLQRGLLLLPVWQYNDEARHVKLVRLTTVCEQVLKAKRDILHAPKGSTEHQHAAIALRNVNLWSEEDCEQYQAYIRALQEQMDSQTWGVELS